MHPWFQTLDWNLLEAKKLTPTFVPDVRGFPTDRWYIIDYSDCAAKEGQLRCVSRAGGVALGRQPTQGQNTESQPKQLEPRDEANGRAVRINPFPLCPSPIIAHYNPLY
jgi:hypothetical protein